MFEEFLNRQVKVPYKDGSQFKVARGKLIEIDDVFIKIQGKLGTLIINKENVQEIEAKDIEPLLKKIGVKNENQ